MEYRNVMAVFTLSIVLAIHLANSSEVLLTEDQNDVVIPEDVFPVKFTQVHGVNPNMFRDDDRFATVWEIRVLELFCSGFILGFCVLFLGHTYFIAKLYGRNVTLGFVKKLFDENNEDMEKLVQLVTSLKNEVEHQPRVPVPYHVRFIAEARR